MGKEGKPVDTLRQLRLCNASSVCGIFAYLLYLICVAFMIFRGGHFSVVTLTRDTGTHWCKQDGTKVSLTPPWIPISSYVWAPRQDRLAPLCSSHKIKARDGVFSLLLAQ